MTIFNKSTPPVADPICDKNGLITPKWRTWFSTRQSFDNSLQHRWYRLLASGFTTIDATSFSRSGSEWHTQVYPAGSRIMVLDGSELVKGVVISCTFDSGPSDVTWTVRMDKGHALTSVSEVYFGILTSSVID